MQSPDRRDWILVRKYAGGSQAAFDEIVKRHLGMVYGTCRREIGDPHLAEDVTQVVFVIFSKKARRMLPGTIVSRWLFKTAVFASRDILRRERRRADREARATEHASTVHVDPLANRPLETAVNAALSTLSQTDWEAVHLRFYEELSLREIGELWWTSEDTAQKRVSRALVRVRKTLASNGIGLTIASITVLMTKEAARAATERCFETILSQSTPTGIGLSSTGIAHFTHGVLRSMLIKNITITAAATLIGVTGTGIVVRSAQSATGSPPSTKAQTPPPAATIPAGIIVIDPGHGGSDSGGLAGGLKEKDLNLAIANYLKTDLSNRGWTVQLTRTDDTALQPTQRAAISNRMHPDYFISVHCDTTALPTRSGATIYYHDNRQRDKHLALSISRAIADSASFSSNGAVSDSTRFTQGFGVLRDSQAPAVLVECGYMSSKSDLAKLTSATMLGRIAQAIVDGMLKDRETPRNHEINTRYNKIIIRPNRL